MVQYSIDINFTLTIMPQRESYYHQTTITARVFNTCEYFFASKYWLEPVGVMLILKFRVLIKSPQRSQLSVWTEQLSSAWRDHLRLRLCGRSGSTRRPSPVSWLSKEGIFSLFKTKRLFWKYPCSPSDIPMK